MQEKKKGNERPVSLHPMEFEEAVGALLEAKPKPRQEPEKKERPASREESTGD